MDKSIISQFDHIRIQKTKLANKNGYVHYWPICPYINTDAKIANKYG